MQNAITSELMAKLDQSGHDAEALFQEINAIRYQEAQAKKTALMQQAKKLINEANNVIEDYHDMLSENRHFRRFATYFANAIKDSLENGKYVDIQERFTRYLEKFHHYSLERDSDETYKAMFHPKICGHDDIGIASRAEFESILKQIADNNFTIDMEALSQTVQELYLEMRQASYGDGYAQKITKNVIEIEYLIEQGASKHGASTDAIYAATLNPFSIRNEEQWNKLNKNIRKKIAAGQLITDIERLSAVFKLSCKEQMIKSLSEAKMDADRFDQAGFSGNYAQRVSDLRQDYIKALQGGGSYAHINHDLREIAQSMRSGTYIVHSVI